MKTLALVVFVFVSVSQALATPPPAATRPYCGGHCGSGSYNHGGGWFETTRENFTCVASSSKHTAYGYGHSVDSACSRALAYCASKAHSQCHVQTYSQD